MSESDGQIELRKNKQIVHQRSRNDKFTANPDEIVKQKQLNIDKTFAKFDVDIDIGDLT